MFGNKILNYKDEILRDLNTLIGFESVDGEKNEECDKALEFILKRAKDFGLDAEKVTDFSGHAKLGSGGKSCAVLSHLDVVPAGGNWSVNPFALTQKDGRLFGRGVADDKGAALINLYCLRALKENNVMGKNTLYAVYGTTEESGMRDMDGYLKKCRCPIWLLPPTATTASAMPKKVFCKLR